MQHVIQLELKDFKLLTLHYTIFLSILHIPFPSNNLSELYPNLVTALKIVLTLPITIASTEICFSRLKILKNYLRCSISQERLSSSVH